MNYPNRSKFMRNIISVVIAFSLMSASAVVAKDVSPKALVGYWKSVEKSDMDAEFLYTIYQEKEFLDTWQMIPYQIISVGTDEIIYKWTQSESIGDVPRTTIVKFLSNGNIVIKFSENSDGREYKKIEQKLWIGEVTAINADAMAELKGKIQEFSDKTSNPKT